jgi:preprotein translocase subunit SecG
MLSTIRLIIALFVLILIAPQTQKSNLVLRVFHESGFFIDYSEAKWFLNILTWVSIFAFLILSLI